MDSVDTEENTLDLIPGGSVQPELALGKAAGTVVQVSCHKIAASFRMAEQIFKMADLLPLGAEPLYKITASFGRAELPIKIAASFRIVE